MSKELAEPTAEAGAQHCPRALRTAFGTFVTGVTVVTTRDEAGRFWGLTANSFTSVSLDPPLLLVCIARNCGSLDAFATTRQFAVNILSDAQQDVSARFASRIMDKFEGVPHESRRSGAPILTGSLTWFDCSVYNRFDAGDHMILLGRIEDFAASEGAPLAYGGGQYRTLHPTSAHRQAA